MKVSRRVFLSGVGAGLSAGSLKLTLADTEAYRGSSLTPPPVFIHVFLRGGMDGLSFMPPRDPSIYDDYELLRPNIRVPSSGQNRSINLSHAGRGFGLHPSCQALADVFFENDLALIHAVGHPEGARTRSHFDSMEYIELGTPGDLSTDSGWLARHLDTAPNLPGGSVVEALASSSTPPTSLLGRFNVATIASTSSFHPNSGTFEDSHLIALEQLYSGAGSLDQAVSSTVEAVQLISNLDLNNYVPGGGAEYPSGSFGDDLEMIAQLIRLDLGMAVATLDFGGWDDHTGLGDNGGGSFANRIEVLSEGLGALRTDLNASGYRGKFIICVQTEFGRRARENADRGVDHGSGTPMAIIGGQAAGGVHGTFPGLGPGDLLDGEDVLPTTDFRQPLSELLLEVLGNPNIDLVFPGFAYSSLGAVLPDQIFSSSFD